MPTLPQRLAVLAAALFMSACGLTPQQRWTIAAGVLVAGAIAAHEQDSGKAMLPNVPTPSVDCSQNPALCR